MDEKGESINQSSNDEGVCRTALATPGLLKIKTIWETSRFYVDSIACHVVWICGKGYTRLILIGI